jgi:hypothetical protein
VTEAPTHLDIRTAQPEDGVLYKVLQQHLETFLKQAAESHDGAGLPRFVEKELRAFLKCGVLNLHVHAIVLDGVFVERDDGQLSSHPAEPPRDADIARLLDIIVTRIRRHLDRKGLLEDDSERGHPLRDEGPLLANCYATSIGSRRTVGLASRGRTEALTCSTSP